MANENLHPLFKDILEPFISSDKTKTDDGWVSRKDKLPPYGVIVECSFDGKTFECMGRFREHTKCMVSGIAPGAGSFENEFEQTDVNLVITDVTHWRYPSNPYSSTLNY